ncbi:MAG: hypothetical protein ACRESX_03600 [Gammaproteobacteria bacterium]
MRKSVSVLTAAVLLSACASIPFSTMWKLRSFNGEDLKTLNPVDIRVVVKLPEKLQFEPDKTTLDVALTPKDVRQTVLEEHASLILLNQGRSVPADVQMAKQGEIWYLMKLNPDGVKSFLDFQQQLAPDIKQHYKSFTISTHLNFGNTNKNELKNLKLTVWLRMKKDEDYFPLLENAALPFK